MSAKQRILVIIGLVISLVFLFLAFSGLNPATVWRDIQQANPLLILAACAWYFIAVTIITLRWQSLLRAVKAVPLARLFPITCMGYMGNNVYPLRAGEILRVVLLQKNERIPIPRAAVVSVAERVFDGLAMLTFVFVALALLNLPNQTLNDVAAFSAPLFLIALIVFFTLAAQPKLFRRIAETISRVLPARLREIALHLTDEILAGLAGLRKPSDLAQTVLFTYMSWMFEASVYWIVSFAFNLNVDYVTMLLVVGVVNLAGLIPASPGQFGVFETFVILVLTAVGVPREPATAYAFVVHMVIWLPVTLVGFFFLARQGLGWNAISNARALEQEAASL
jgi:glycosyltransferase 2 family protein